MSRRRFSGRRILHGAQAVPPNPLLAGTDGDLVVDATSFDIAAGSIKKYNSISVINSGQLNIGTGSSFLWTQIGCKTTWLVDPSSVVNLANLSIACPGTLIATTALDGTSLSRVLQGQSAGGDGGTAYIAGGTSSSGNGGGGDSAIFAGGNAVSGNGGFGGAGEDASVGPLPGGYGGDEVDLSGGPGLAADSTGTPFQAAGSAGGGGFRGRHSNLLYFVANTINFQNSLSINGAGSGAGNGGGGGEAGSDGTAQGGSGGGGGGGGNGGVVQGKYHTAIGTSILRILVSGGQAGEGGSGGIGSGLFESYDGAQGNQGTQGSDGVISLSTF